VNDFIRRVWRLTWKKTRDEHDERVDVGGMEKCDQSYGILLACLPPEWPLTNKLMQIKIIIRIIIQIIISC
jgi:hypothetical protein